MRIRLSRRAERDLAGIADPIGAINPPAAAAIGAAIRAALDLIAVHPGLGRRQRDSDLRQLVVPRYGDLIYDRVILQADVAAIVTIRHHARARPSSDA